MLTPKIYDVADIHLMILSNTHFKMPTEMSLFTLKETDSADKGKERGSKNNEKIITIIIHKI